MGASEVQVPATPPATNSALGRSRCGATPIAVRPLGAFAGARPDNGSRMRRESHVRFCERAGVRLPCATHRNIYVRSRRAGERVMASMSRFLTQKLRLKVNEAKSAVARPEERKFLGFSISNDGGAHHEKLSTN